MARERVAAREGQGGRQAEERAAARDDCRLELHDFERLRAVNRRSVLEGGRFDSFRLGAFQGH